MKRRTFFAGSLGTLGVAAAAPALAQLSAGPPPGFVRLRVAPGELTVDGKVGKAYRIEQEDGRLGWTGRRGARFQVALDNGLAEPVAIHWHGLVLPNGQDGVPYVTQPPIKPGERRLYDFPLVQAGTYWMHSHFGLQEQVMVTAPLIILDERSPQAMQDVVMMLNDFTTRDPAAILESLRATPIGGDEDGRRDEEGHGLQARSHRRGLRRVPRQPALPHRSRGGAGDRGRERASPRHQHVEREQLLREHGAAWRPGHRGRRRGHRSAVG